MVGLKEQARACGDCKLFRKFGLCPRLEWTPSFKNRWGMRLNHVACMSSDSACEKFQPKKKKRHRNAKRDLERLVEALQ